MRNATNLIVLVALFVTMPAAHAELDRLILDGQLHGPGGTRSATLRLLCDPDAHGGAISLELWVPQAFKLKDFDYDDFEGPDAAAGNRTLSGVSVTGGSNPTEIRYAAGGWYSGEDPDTFVFGLSQLSHRQGKIATLLKAIDAQHTQLVWVQTGFDDPKRELRAMFPLDAATVKRIHAAVDVCLAPGAKVKPRSAP
jgi:hypothetical protein